MSLPEPGPDGLIHRAQAVRFGVTDSELSALTRHDDLRRLYWGRYRDTPSLVAMDAESRHAMSVRAAVAAQRSPVVVSHASAAILHGLPLWNVDLTRVHLTQQRFNTGRRTRLLHVHEAAPESLSTQEVSGLAVTSVSRTVFDLATSVGFEEAVVLADGALKRNLTTRAALEKELEAGAHRHGRKRAAAVIAFADGRSESVGESRSRVGMSRAGVPLPALQQRVFDEDGREAGRCDFGWPEHGLLGEFDGRAKYGRLLTPGQEPVDAFLAERRRQDRLHDLGHDMIRWIWAELSRPSILYPRILAALARSARRHLR